MVENRPVESFSVNGRTVRLLQGDITEQSSDAIVNAANSRLQLGGGVAGAIRQKGGPTIQRECDRIGGTPVGTAVLTTSGQLKAAAVIHAVGPRMGEGEEADKLARAIRSALRIAAEKGMKTISFPAVSTGIFGFPAGAAARIMLNEVLSHLQTDTPVDVISICLFSAADYRIFVAELQRQTGVQR